MNKFIEQCAINRYSKSLWSTWSSNEVILFLQRITSATTEFIAALCANCSTALSWPSYNHRRRCTSKTPSRSSTPSDSTSTRSATDLTSPAPRRTRSFWPTSATSTAWGRPWPGMSGCRLSCRTAQSAESLFDGFRCRATMWSTSSCLGRQRTTATRNLFRRAHPSPCQICRCKRCVMNNYELRNNCPTDLWVIYQVIIVYFATWHVLIIFKAYKNASSIRTLNFRNNASLSNLCDGNKIWKNRDRIKAQCSLSSNYTNRESDRDNGK